MMNEGKWEFVGLMLTDSALDVSSITRKTGTRGRGRGTDDAAHTVPVLSTGTGSTQKASRRVRIEENHLPVYNGQTRVPYPRPSANDLTTSIGRRSELRGVEQEVIWQALGPGVDLTSVHLSIPPGNSAIFR